MRTIFSTGAWAELKDDESRLTKLIKTSVFFHENGGISTDFLILFGVLNCAGDAKCRSEVLYTIFQDGGVDKQKALAA